uniref:Uncharacterized protein n=1 Tax=Timema genevievae TaxID=629358 RepID=A0A7R9JN09_TIMGE|nr:unnamed protein product [Timema genevievae]
MANGTQNRAKCYKIPADLQQNCAHFSDPPNIGISMNHRSEAAQVSEDDIVEAVFFCKKTQALSISELEECTEAVPATMTDQCKVQADGSVNQQYLIDIVTEKIGEISKDQEKVMRFMFSSCEEKRAYQEEPTNSMAGVTPNSLLPDQMDWVGFPPQGKTNLSTPGRDSNLNLLVLGSLVYCESEALDHAATEVVKEKSGCIRDFKALHCAWGDAGWPGVSTSILHLSSGIKNKLECCLS